MAAVVALLFVFAVAGFWVLGAESFEMGIGHVVEDDAALAIEESGFAMAQFLLKDFAMRED